ncbi:MAG: AMP-binding protein [Allosphingosinicella sp.]
MASAHADRFVRDRLPPPEAQPEFLFDLPELRYPERLNAAVELIDRGPADALAVVNDAGAWTYGEMRDISDRIARLLTEEEGLVPGNRVLLRGPNGAMTFAAWLGVLKAGGVLVTTMPILRAGEIAALLERAEVHHAIVDERGLADFLAAADATGLVRSLLVYRGDAGGGALEKRLNQIEPGFAAVPTHRDDPAMIAFTSGTTGRPKGCVHYHRDVLAPADSFARHLLAPKAGERWVCSAPIAFTFGLGMSLIFPWRFGGTAVTVEQPGPGALLEAVAKHRVNRLATAPTAYKAMLPLLRDHDFSSLAACVSAGEHLPAATWRAWREATGIGIVDGIGATEMMHIFISAAGDDIRPGSTGKAVPGYRACVLGEDGEPLPHGIGALAVKGPTGCRYFDDPRQADYVKGGWNVTGDTYRLDEEGRFWFVARSDDMIVSAGYNIAAPEVENALYAHPAVQECAVVGVPCEERGRKVKAFVVAAPGHQAGEALARALQDHVKAAIAPYKYPREVEFVAALPKTATGKLQRFQLR